MSERSRRPMGGGHGMRSVEKAKDFKGAMSRLFQYMGKYKFRFGLLLQELYLILLGQRSLEKRPQSFLTDW